MRIVGRKKISQQLVEFLLVAPFMVIILGILTEYAYALNINLTITQALKAVTSPSYCSGSVSGPDCFGIYSNIKPEDDENATDSKTLTLVKNGFKQYLKDNNVPVGDKNNIDVGFTREGQTVVFMAAYTYIPAFTLPNVYFKILPDKFNFFTTVAVPAAFLGDNSYYKTNGVDSTALDNIWSASNYSDEANVNPNKKGIIKSNYDGGRWSFTFLIPNSELNGSSTSIRKDGPLAQPLELVTWNGSITQTAVDMATGELAYWERKELFHPDTCTNSDGTTYDCSWTERWIETTKSGTYSPSGQVVFVHDGQIHDVTDLGNWNPSGASDLSPSTINVPLKRMVAITDGTVSLGNYDNIKVSDYNMGVAMGDNTYKVKYYGSTKIIYTSDNIGVLGTGTTTGGYNFGAPVNHD